MLLASVLMNGHGGDNWLNEACKKLESARALAKTSRDLRQINYLSGHAIELALVAIGLKQRQLRLPPGNEHGGRWHDLGFLATRHNLRTAIESDKAITASWLVVRGWDSNGRFPSAPVNRQAALEMLRECDKVLEWLKQRYHTI